MAPPGESLSAISIGVVHTCALRLDGRPVCWGIGYDTHTQSAKQSEFETISSQSFVAISSGQRHVCVLRADGAALCWGASGDGRTAVPHGETFTELSSGYAPYVWVETRRSCRLLGA